MDGRKLEIQLKYEAIILNGKGKWYKYRCDLFISFFRKLFFSYFFPSESFYSDCLQKNLKVCIRTGISSCEQEGFIFMHRSYRVNTLWDKDKSQAVLGNIYIIISNCFFWRSCWFMSIHLHCAMLRDIYFYSFPKRSWSLKKVFGIKQARNLDTTKIQHSQHYRSSQRCSVGLSQSQGSVQNRTVKFIQSTPSS